MHRIVAGITDLNHHLQAIEQTPQIYRPPCCPHCGTRVVWNHGHYERKADLCSRGEASRNPVPILRYWCAACRRTCSRLPECIAPRRWYNWGLQQIALSASGEPASGCPRPAARTVGRWRDWLEQRARELRFVLSSRFAQLGRQDEGEDGFWRGVFASLGLSCAMAWCDQEVSVP